MELNAALRRLEIEYREVSDELRSASEVIRTTVASIVRSETTPTCNVISRVKSLESAREKIERKYLVNVSMMKDGDSVLHLITDLIGVRIVCLYSDHEDAIRDQLSRQFMLIEETDKSAALEDEGLFGYRGLNLRFEVDDRRRDLPEFAVVRGRAFEVQVRSVVEDAWSVLDHSIKYKRNLPFQLSRRILRLAALAELMDAEFRGVRDAWSVASQGASVDEGAGSDLIANVIEFAMIL